MVWYVTTFYYFTPLTDLETHQKAWEQKALELEIKGLLILGAEGFNTTCCSQIKDNLESFKHWVMETYPDSKNMLFKDSVSEIAPFKRYRVRVRPEIVTLGAPEITPNNEKHHHLSPEEWNDVLKNDPNAVVVDTRNWYEYNIGSFHRAINPNIDKFTEFPEWFQKQGVEKNQKILIFCTGGIRCEKGIYELERQGYQNVYQLEGGIINYIQKHPNDQFWGECFVFDHRVALDQELKPSKRYDLCPHCGQPGDLKIDCKHCDTQYLACPTCNAKEHLNQLCSKNCAYHHKLNPLKKGRKQLRVWERMNQNV